MKTRYVVHTYCRAKLVFYAGDKIKLFNNPNIVYVEYLLQGDTIEHAKQEYKVKHIELERIG